MMQEIANYFQIIFFEYNCISQLVGLWNRLFMNKAGQVK